MLPLFTSEIPQQSRAEAAASLCDTVSHSCDIALEHAVEAACPRLHVASLEMFAG
jgi:hypothetical protein